VRARASRSRLAPWRRATSDVPRFRAILRARRAAPPLLSHRWSAQHADRPNAKSPPAPRGQLDMIEWQREAGGGGWEWWREERGAGVCVGWMGGG